MHLWLQLSCMWHRVNRLEKMYTLWTDQLCCNLCFYFNDAARFEQLWYIYIYILSNSAVNVTLLKPGHWCSERRTHVSQDRTKMSLTLSCLAEDCWQSVSPETRFNITMSLLCHRHLVSWHVMIIQGFVTDVTGHDYTRIRDCDVTGHSWLWYWHAIWVQEMYI